MTERRITNARHYRQASDPIDHEMLANYAGVSARDLMKYCNEGLIQPIKPIGRYGIYFEEEAIYLVRQAEQIRRDYAANLRAAATMLRMKREIEKLRREIKFHREL
jgi:hypothetical protein